MTIPDMNLIELQSASREHLAQRVALLQQERLNVAREIGQTHSAPGSGWSWTPPAEPGPSVRRVRPTERYPGDNSIWYDREPDNSGWRGIMRGRPGGVIEWLQVVAGAGDVYGGRTLVDATAERDVGSAYDRVARTPMPWSPEYNAMLERQDDADRESTRPGSMTEPMHYAYVERTACGEDPAWLLYTNDWDIVTCNDCLAARTNVPYPSEVDGGR